MRRRWRRFKSGVVMPMVNFGRTVGRSFVRGGAMIGIALAGAVKHANDFRTEMASVNTMLNGEDLEQFSAGIVKMSGRFGQAKGVLAKGLYDILSAGVGAGDAMQFLEVATKAAIGGNTDAATSVDAMTTVLNAYGMEAKEATRISDVLFQVVKDGKITYAELAENVGKIAPTAKAAGLSLEQLGAAIATIVKTEKPERAMTSLRQAMFQAAEDGQNLMELAERFKGASLEEVIAAGINKKTAAGIVILGNNFATLTEELQKFQNTAGRSDEAFAKMDKVRFWQKLWQTVLGLVTRVAVKIDTVLGPAVQLLRDQIDRMGDSPGFQRFLENVRRVSQMIVNIAAAIATGQGRQKAVRGLQLVVVSAFTTGARKIGEVLLRVFPILGRMLADAIANPFRAAKEKKMALGMARENIDRKFATGELSAEFGMSNKELKKYRRGLIDQEFGRILQDFRDNRRRGFEEEFSTAIGGGSSDMQIGLQLLEEAAIEGAAAMDNLRSEMEGETAAKKENERETRKETVARKKVYEAISKETGARKKKEDAEELDLENLDATPEEIMDRLRRLRETPERDFTELRRMGANIIGATMPGDGDAREQKTLEQIAADIKAEKELLRSVRDNMERLVNSAIVGEDPPTVF